MSAPKEAKIMPVLEDFEIGDRIYRYRGTVPYFGTVSRIKMKDVEPHIKCKMDNGAVLFVAFQDDIDVVYKALPLATIKPGDVISHVDFSGVRWFYTVISHVFNEQIALEAHHGSRITTVVERDYACASMEDEFIGWELEA